MPRPPRNLRFARPWVEPVDPPQSPTLRQKSRHLMQPPTTSYPHGYSGNQHRSSTCVKYHFLLPIPGWAVKTCHCTRHTEHYSATNHPRGRILRVSYPGIPGTRPYPFTIDPPRLILDPASTNRRSNKEARLTGPGVFSPSHPLRHHGVRGWPAILGTRRYSYLHSAQQNFTSKAPLESLPPLDPIKGEAGNSTKGSERRTSNKPVTIPP
jgi:hypothetical protein